MENFIINTEPPVHNKAGAIERPGFKSGWTRAMTMARFKAALIHLLVSALIAGCVTLPIVFWLYPSPFFEAAGGMHLLVLILGVDVVLGPTLTFLVFDQRKKSLRKDLAVIAICQLLALGYGLYATAMSRPAFMTFVVDRFETVTLAQVDAEELKRAPEGFREVRWGHPQMAFAEQPSDQDERSNILMAFLNSGIDLKEMFRYYRPLEKGLPLIAAKAKPLSELNKFNDPARVSELLAPWVRDRELGYLPMQGKKRDLTVLVDRKSGQLVKVLDLKPWE